MSRLTAFAIHLGISLLVFAVLAWIILYRWFPDFFFAIDGGWEGLRIIIAVDLVLGPLLTLIVYRAGKPGLKTDLTLIGVFQALCLAGGMWVVYSERPLAFVYVDGHFYSMSADSYREYEQPVPDLRGLPGPWPKRVQIAIPDDPHEQSALRGEAFTSGQPLRVLSERYEPFAMNMEELPRAYALDKIRQRDADVGALQAWQAEHPGQLEDYAFFPLGTRYRYIFIGFRRSDASFAGLLATPGPL